MGSDTRAHPIWSCVRNALITAGAREAWHILVSAAILALLTGGVRGRPPKLLRGNDHQLNIRGLAKAIASDPDMLRAYAEICTATRTPLDCAKVRLFTLRNIVIALAKRGYEPERSLVAARLAGRAPDPQRLAELARRHIEISCSGDGYRE